MDEIIFTKKLCRTDANKKLIVPMAGLHLFNIPDGQHFINFKATDTKGAQRTFRLSTRKNDRKGNPRPEITGNWLRFVNEKGLKADDYRVILSKKVDEATGDEQFFIKAERKIFGAWLPLN